MTTWEVCRGVEGPEDIVLDRSQAVPRVLAGSDHRRRLLFKKPGYIVAVSLTPAWSPAVPLELQGRDDVRFAPLGLHLVSTGGRTLLYAINKARRGDRIEVFRVGKSDLTWDRPPLESSLLTDANDLWALPSGEVYVTNSSATGGLRGVLDKARYRATGYVARMAPNETWDVVAPNLAFANGIAISADGLRVYVGCGLSQGLRAYDRGAHGELTFGTSVPLRGDVDNLTWDGNRLIATVHPSRSAFARHALGRWFKAPSRVVSVSTQTMATNVEFEDDGTNVAACSTAIADGDHWYLGQVLNDGLTRRSRP